MVKVTVPVSVDLNEQLIQVLAEHGDDLILALAELIKEAKWAEKNEQARLRSELFEQKLIQRKADLFRDGRLYHRLLRHLLNDIPAQIKSKTRTVYRQDAVEKIAYRYRLETRHVELVIKLHRNRFFKKLKERRLREVLRLFVDGHSDEEISTLLRIGHWLVSRTLMELRERAKTDRISLLELQKREAEARLVRRLATTDGTIIHRSDISRKRDWANG